MAFTPIAETTYCEIRWQHGTNLGENTAWYKWTGSPPSPAELLQLCTAVRDGVADRIRLCMSQGVTMREVHCRNMDTAVANQATLAYAPGTAGARIGSPVASNEAANVVRRTGKTGRSQHGAVRVSEFVEGDVDGNSLSSVLMGLLANVGLSLLEDYVAGRFVGALGSKKNGNSVELLDAGVIDSNIDSQKTRLNQHGD